MSTMVCPDDAFLYELVGGRLDEADLASADTHLDGCAECREVVVELSRGSERGNGGLGRGSVVGRFVVVGVLGSGGMGVVYGAYDPDLERKVALKLVRPGAGREARERLVGEAQAMAQLAHPNVAAVYDVGRHVDDVYLAMELVAGRTLRQWMADGHTLSEIVRVFADAGRGLAAAHEAGLVHRDFKPENAVVGDDGRARVLDFGLASFDDDGTVAGTPSYMAPEQLAGKPATAASDQFAFCVALYEALAGRRPFEGADIEQLEAALVEPPEPLPSRAPRWLRRVVTRGLSPEVSGRFPSMNALLAELDRDRGVRLASWAITAAAFAVSAALFYASGPDSGTTTVAAQCTGAPEIAGHIWGAERRNALREALAAVRPYGRTTAQAAVTAVDAWRDEWVLAHEHTCRATRVSGEQSEAVMELRMQCLERRLREMDSVVSELSVGGPLAAEHAVGAIRHTAPIAECADVDSLSRLSPGPEGSDQHTAQLQTLIDQVRARARMSDASGVELAKKLREREPPHPVTRADALVASSQAHRVAGDFAVAVADAERALWLAQKARAAHLEARAWLAIVAAHAARGDFDEAARAGEHARAAVDRLGTPPGIERSVVLLLGVVHTNLADYPAAETALGRVSDLDRRIDGQVDTTTLTALGNLYRAQGKYRDAIKAHEDAGRLDEQALGDRHPRIGRHYHNIAGVYRLMGKPEQAIPRYTTALALKSETFGPDHPETALTHNSLGLSHLDAGELAKAEKQFREALRIFEAIGHEDRAAAMHNLALSRIDEDPTGALDLLMRAEPIYARIYGPDHKRMARLVQAMDRARAARKGRRPEPKPAPPATHPDAVYMPSQNLDP